MTRSGANRMAEREVRCRDGSRWKVIAAARSSLYRLELAFEPADRPGDMLRGEAEASDLSELTDDELCFLIQQARES